MAQCAMPLTAGRYIPLNLTVLISRDDPASHERMNMAMGDVWDRGLENRPLLPE